MKETYTSTYPLLALSLTGSVAAIILTVWFALTEYQHFYRSQMERMEISAATTNRVVSAFINERKDLVKSFILYNVEKIEEISENPDNQDAIDVFGKKIRDYFPSRFSFIIRRKDGEYVPDYLEEIVGGFCRRDMSQFYLMQGGETKRNSNTSIDYRPLIHPQPFNFHFDITSEWQSKSGNDGLFMVNFHPRNLVAILKAHQAPGHSIYLLREDIPSLIEVSADGWRETFKREGRLTDDELKAIVFRQAVEGTRWQIGYVPNADIFHERRLEVIISGISFIFVIFVIASISVCWNIVSERNRVRLREEIVGAYNNLEILVDERTSDLRASETRAKKASEAKSEFLSFMSRELRTPLNAILGFGQLLTLRSEAPLTAEQKICTGHIMNAGNHLLELIDRMLVLGTTETGHQNFSGGEIALDEVCRECLALFDKSATDRRLSIATDFAATRTIMADNTRLKQVLINLLSNAVHYTKEGGSITLVSEDVPDDRVRISVTDTGPGIGEDQQAGLFEPNRPGNGEGSVAGTGIGLSIVKQRVEGDGRRCWI
ncbi:MAG: hypothetical protein JKY68_02840 [Rhodospirillales bacterium]|nr:hypothetical protein [Rhodospirillales bacterium]